MQIGIIVDSVALLHMLSPAFQVHLVPSNVEDFAFFTHLQQVSVEFFQNFVHVLIVRIQLSARRLTAVEAPRLLVHTHC